MTLPEVVLPIALSSGLGRASSSHDPRRKRRRPLGSVWNEVKQKRSSSGEDSEQLPVRLYFDLWLIANLFRHAQRLYWCSRALVRDDPG